MDFDPTAAFVLLAASVLTGSLVPAERMPAWLPNDKLMHLLAYGALAALLSLKFRDPVTLAGAVLACFLGSVGIEWLQKFVPGRMFCVRDLAANGAGLLMGAAIGSSLLRDFL